MMMITDIQKNKIKYINWSLFTQNGITQNHAFGAYAPQCCNGAKCHHKNLSH